MDISRRTFLRSAASGLLVAAAAPVLVEPGPVRRFWQVGRSAPVGYGAISTRMEQAFEKCEIAAQRLHARQNQAVQAYLQRAGAGTIIGYPAFAEAWRAAKVGDTVVLVPYHTEPIDRDEQRRWVRPAGGIITLHA